MTSDRPPRSRPCSRDVEVGGVGREARMRKMLLPGGAAGSSTKKRQPSTCGAQAEGVRAVRAQSQARAGRGAASPFSPPKSSLVVVGRLGGQETSVSMVRPMLRRRPGEPLGGASRYRRGTRGRSTDLRGGGEGGRKHVARGQGICERRRRDSGDAWAGVASTSGGHACFLMIVSSGVGHFPLPN